MGINIKTGAFYGVGVGPGDPELITLKALNILKAASVIAMPGSSTRPDNNGRALSIISSVLGEDGLRSKDILRLHLPMTRDKQTLVEARNAAAIEISKVLLSGRDAAFVTLGDPMTYSTFSYLVPLVKAAVPGVVVKVIPGITSFNAAAARLLMPLAEADETIAIIPAPYRLDLVQEALVSFDTVIIMKVNRDFDELVKLIEEAGFGDRAYLVSKVGWPDEMITGEIGKLKGTKTDYFSTIIVKKKGVRL